MVIQPRRRPFATPRSSRGTILTRVSTLALVACGLMLAARPAFAQTLPVLGPGAGADGGATIATAANAMTVNVNNSSRVITWTSYNVGNIGETVSYTSANPAQPYAVLNRVLPGAPSLIQGGIFSQNNIAVWIVNPNGITFSPTGAFNGGSLVLSTLDVANDALFLAGTATGLVGASTSPISLQAGAGAIISSGAVVIAGQDITAAKSITATREVALIAARDVSFPMSLASPLAITVNAGTTLGTAQVSANGAITAASVRLVGASEGGAIANLLGVGAGSALTANAVNGAVVLATRTDVANNVTIASAAAVDGIVMSGALNASDPTGNVALNATGAITSTGSYAAGNRIDLTGSSVTASNATLSLNSVTAASGAVSLTTTVGNLFVDTVATGGGNATLTSTGNVAGRTAPGGPTITAGATGDVEVTGQTFALTASTGRNLSLTSNGANLVFPGAATFTHTGNLSLTTGIGFDVNLAAPTISPGAFTINSGRDVIGDGVTATNANVGIVAVGGVRGQGANRMLITATGGASTVNLTAGGTALLGAVQGGAATGSVTLTAGTLDLTSASARDLSLTSQNANLTFDGATSTWTRNLSLTAGAGRDVLIGASLVAATPGSITINAGRDILGNAITLADGNVVLTAGRDVTGQAGGQMGIAANALNNTINVTATAGRVLLGTVTAGATTAVLAADQIVVSGQIVDVGDVAALNGRIALTSTLAATGDITVRTRVSSNGNATLNSAANVLIAPSTPTTGFVRSIAGNVAVTAAGAVSGFGDNAVMIADRGFGTVSSNGDINATGLGDLRVNSLTAGGAVNVNVGGSVTGRASTPDVVGGALLASGVGGTVTVNATTGPVKLNTVIANSTISVTAPGGIALGTATSTTQGVTNTSATGVYVRQLTQVLTANLGTSAALGLNPAGVTTTGVLEAGFGTTAITANVAQDVVVAAGNNAQLGAVVGRDITAQARGLTATSAVAARALSLTATVGTLQLGNGSAVTTATLQKTGGALATAGDELRVTTLLSGGGTVQVTTGTSARLAQATSIGGAINVTATLGDVTGLAGASVGTSDTNFGRAGLSATAPTGDVSVTAARLAQLGTVAAGRNVAVTGGNAVPTNGAVDVTSATATTGALQLTARAVAPVIGAVFDGDIILGTGTAGTTATLSNTATGGNQGNVSIGDRLIAAGTATLTSAGNVLIAPVDGPTPTTGFVRSTGGNISVTAGGSVFGLGDNTTLPAQTGFGAISALGPTGNVTIVGTGDARIDSITAGGSITGGVTGSLTGQGAGSIGTNVIGGALQATGAGGGVSVAASNGAGGVVKLAQIAANQNVSVAANGIAIGTLSSTAGSVTTTPFVPNNFYIGSLAQTGPVALTFNGPLAVDPSSVTTTGTFEAAFGTTALAAGTSMALTIGRNAQLSTVTSVTGAAITARALTATSATTATTGAALALTALAGTLQLGTGNSGGATSLVKQGGLIATAGDELRVTTSLTSAGTATVTSNTNARLTSVASTLGDVTIGATLGDVTGAAGASVGTSDTAFGRATVAANGVGRNAAVTAAGLVQIGTIGAGNNVSVTAGNVFPTTRGAIDVTQATATAGSLAMSALAQTASGIYDGRIRLGTGTAGGNATLTNVDRGGTLGDITVATQIAANGDIIIDSARDATLPLAAAGLAGGTTGSLAVRTRRNAALGTLTANEDIGVQAGGTVQLTSATGGDDVGVRGVGLVSVGTAAANGTGTDTRSINFANPNLVAFAAEILPSSSLSLVSTTDDVTATGALSARQGLTVNANRSATLVGDLTTQIGNVSVVAGLIATVGANVNAGLNYAVDGGTGVALGSALARTQQARGTVTLRALGGDMTQGAGLLTLTVNSDATGFPFAEALTVSANAGSILLGNTDFIGGSVAGRQSAISLAALTDVLAGKVDGDRLTVSAGRDVTINRAVVAGSLARGADSGVLALGNQTVNVSAGRNFLAPTVTTLGAAHDIDIRAGGAATATQLAATGMVVTRAGSNVTYGRVSAGEDIALSADLGSITLGDGTTPFDVQAGDDINVSAGLGVSITSATTLGTGPDTRSVSFAGPNPFASYVAEVTPGANIALSATSVTVTRDVASAGNYTISGFTGITLGDGVARTQSARGALTLIAPNADIRQGAGGLTLTANSDQIGAEAMSLTATTGAIILGTTDLIGGSTANRESAILLRSGTSTTFRNADGDRLAVVAGGNVTTTGVTNAGALARGADSVLIGDPQTVDVRGATVSLGTVNALGVGHDIDVAATGPLTVGAMTAARNLTASGTVLNAASLVATSGTLLATATAGNATVGTGTAGGAGTISAVGNATITTSLTTVGDATLTAGGAAIAPLIRSTGAGVTVTGATVGLTSAQAQTVLDARATGGALNLVTGTAGTNAQVQATGATTIGSLTAANTLTASGATLKATTLTATGGALLASATGGNATIATASAGGVGTVSATGDATITTGMTAVGLATLTAGGAATATLIRSTGAGVTVTGVSVALTMANAQSVLDARATAGPLNLTTGTAGTNALVQATGETTIGSLTAGNNLTASGLTVTAATLAATGGALSATATGGNATVATATAGGAGTIMATGNVAVTGGLTSVGLATLTAGGIASAASIRSTGAGVTVTGASVQLTNATAQTMLEARATSGIANLVSGTAGTDALVQATGATVIGSLTAANNVTASGRTLDATTLTATGGALLATATAGDATVGTATAGGAGTISATGNASATTSLITGGRATLAAGGMATTPLIRSTAADVVVTGATVGIGVAEAATALSMTASNGNLTLDQGTAGTTATLATTGGAGDVIVTTSLLSGGAGTVTSVRNAQIARATATTGELRITAAADMTGIGGGNADLTATAGRLSVTAGPLARLGTIVSGGDTEVAADTVNVTTATAGGALTLIARAGNATLGAGVAGGAALVSATGNATATSLTAGGLATMIAGGAATAALIRSTGAGVTVTGATVDLTDAVAQTVLDLRATGGALNLVAGTAGTDALVQAAGATTIGSLSAANNLTASGATLTATTLTATGGALLASATGGNATVGTATAGGAGTISATGNATATTSLITGGRATLTAGGVATMPLIRSTAADVVVTGASIGVTTAEAATALSMTASNGNLTLDRGTAGTTATLATTGGAGDVIVTTRLLSGGGGTVTSVRNAQIAQAVATTGELRVTAAGDVTGIGAGNADLTATAGRLVVTAGPLARLGPIVSGSDTEVAADTANVTTATAGGALTLTARAGNTTLGTGTAGGAATVSATGNATITTGLTTVGLATLTAGGAATAALIRSTGAGVTVTGATVDVTTANAATALDARATGGALNLATGTAGTSALVQATAATTVGSLTAATDATVRGATVAATTLAATSGVLTVVATAGNATLGTAAAGGAGSVTATGNAAITTGLTTGGLATLTAGGAVTAAVIRSTGAGVTVTGATVDVTTATAQTVLDARATGGTLNVTTGTAGSNALVQATGATTIGSLIATNNATVSGATLNATTLTATGGALTATSTGGTATVGTGLSGGAALVTASGSANVTSLRSTGSTATVTAGPQATVGSITGRGAVAVTADAVTVSTTAISETAGYTLTARTGDANIADARGVTASTITAARDALIGTAATTGGNLSVTAARDVAGTGGGRANLSAGGAGSTLNVQATGGLARLGTLGSAAAMTVRARVSLDIANATSGGDVGFDTDGKATLGGAVNAAGRTVTVTASDADIGGMLTANRAVIVNRANGANTLRLGNGAGGTGGFELTQDELNRIAASEIALDAGTATGLTAQNIEIGSLALAAGAGSSRVDVLGTRRIDVTGTMTADGSAATRVIRFGGASVAAGKADTIRVAAKADGTGGKILMGSANVELRGVRIGVGQDQGFLQSIGVTAGATPLSSAAVAAQFIGNPNSSLYNAGIGGVPYAPPGQTIFAARTLNVQITDYALFQNTALAGVTGGAVLGGTAGSPINGALVASGPNPPDAGGFALFGSINGISETATALLGPSAISITAIDRANIRVNGCIVGSGGGGCLVNVISQPTLTVFDSSRADVFKTAADFQIPFDPVVGTNNESLFGDVGTFGLADIPLAPPTVCADPKDCPTPQEPKK